MGKFSAGWQLFKESFALLAADSEMLVFPILSGISALALAAGFFIPLYRDGTLQAVSHRHATWDDYAILFAWYYLTYFVGIFFNGALMACANMRLSGQRPSVTAGLAMAFGRLERIAGWALVAATVGLVLGALRDRNNKLLALLASGVSLAWSLITYLIVPVLLFEDHGVFGSVHRSEQLFRARWGEEVAGNFGFGLLAGLLSLPALLLPLVCWRTYFTESLILMALYLILLWTILSAVKGIFTVALYRYAAEGAPPAGFSAALIDSALSRHNPLPQPVQAPWDEY